MPPQGSRKTTAQARSQMALALSLVSEQYFFDAIKVFRHVAEEDDTLAGAALCNIGLTYLKMRLYKEAEKAFSQVIRSYPKSKLNQTHPSEERGLISAKAYLGRVHARLALDDVTGAGKDLGKLESLDSSYVVDAQEHRISFRELAAMQF